MRKLLAILLLTMLCSMAGWSAILPEWEEVTTSVPAVEQTLDKDADTEIVVRDGYIYLWSDKPVTVKLFSILGQLITQENLKPGLHRIQLSSRGIYILRAGTTTRRITL